MNKRTIGAIRALRQVHFIDIENLCGKCNPSEADVEFARTLYFATVPVSANDLFVVSSSHFNTAAVAYGWPSAQHVFKSGRDGAEIQLEEEIRAIAVSEKFSAAFVGSGDHYLSSAVSKLVGEMGFVTVVSLADSLSNEMFGTGADILLLDSKV